MQRLPPLDLNDLSAGQREVYETILRGARGSAEGPLRAWLASPEFASRAQSLGLKCRFSSCLAPRLSELAILIVAAYWKSEFEWHAHAPLALKQGLSTSVADAVRMGLVPRFQAHDEAIVHRFATELLVKHSVSPETFQCAHEQFGDEGVVDLIGILGYYTLIAMTIAAFEIPAAEGAEAAFAGATIASQT